MSASLHRIKATKPTPPSKSSPSSDEAPIAVRSRDRKATERSLVDSALKFVERDGVLQGLNLRDVADHAGVARGHIYNYFGSRQELLRQALSRRWDELHEYAQAGSELPLVERRLRFFAGADARRDNGFALAALLVLDGDDEVDPGPFLEAEVARLRRDVDEGNIHPDHACDLEALHLLMGSLTRGYSIFRSAYARRLGIHPDTLDARVGAIFESWMRSLAVANPPPNRSQAPASI